MGLRGWAFSHGRGTPVPATSSRPSIDLSQICVGLGAISEIISRQGLEMLDFVPEILKLDAFRNRNIWPWSELAGPNQPEIELDPSNFGRWHASAREGLRIRRIVKSK